MWSENKILKIGDRLCSYNVEKPCKGQWLYLLLFSHLIDKRLKIIVRYGRKQRKTDIVKIRKTEFEKFSTLLHGIASTYHL